MGDFILPTIDWTSWSAPGEDSPAGSLLEVLDDAFLFQYVTSHTRLYEGLTPSTLDLIITNEDNVIDTLITCDPLGRSDHLVLEFEYVYSVIIPDS